MTPPKVWLPRRRQDRPGKPWIVVWRDCEQRRHQETFEGGNVGKGQAQAFYADKLRELQQAAPLVSIDRDISVRSFGTEHWLPGATDLKRKTLEGYKDTLLRHVCPTIGDMRVRDVHEQHVSALLAEKLKTYKRGTVRLIYSTIRRLLSRAKFAGVVDSNRAASVWKELPGYAREKAKRRHGPEDVKAMSQADLAAFLAAGSVTPQYYPLFFVLARTGMRIGEGLGLQLADVDLATGEIHVQRNLGAPKKGRALDQRIGSTKNTKERFVQIGPELVDYLQGHIARRRADNLAAGLAEERSPWIFATRDGGPLDEFSARKRMTKMLKAAGLPTKFTPHCLRHTYATLMLDKGAPPKWVADQLGHSLAILFGYYSWAMPGGSREHAGLLDARRPAAEAKASNG